MNEAYSDETIPVHAMTPNSLAVLKSCILEENYVTVMHVPLSTRVENTFFAEDPFVRLFEKRGSNAFRD